MAIDPVLMRQVWTHLRNRDTRPRPTLPEGRGTFTLTAGLTARDEDGGGTYAELYLYDEIGFWGVSAADVVAQLLTVSDPAIVVHINSPGGDVFDGVAIYNALRDHPATVDVRVDGLAASAASFIAMAGDTVHMNRASQLMIHDASGVAMGNAETMREMMNLLERVSDTIAGIYAARAGGTVAQWRNLMRLETWYSSGEAVAAGLADSVEAAATEPVDGAPVAARFDLALASFLYAGRGQAPAPVPLAVATGPTPDPVAESTASTGSGALTLDHFTQLAAAFSGVFTPTKEAV